MSDTAPPIGLQALQQADGVFSSLPHDAALLAVGDRVAAHATRGAAWVDTSTVSPGASARAAEGNGPLALFRSLFSRLPEGSLAAGAAIETMILNR